MIVLLTGQERVYRAALILSGWAPHYERSLPYALICIDLPLRSFDILQYLHLNRLAVLESYHKTIEVEKPFSRIRHWLCTFSGFISLFCAEITWPVWLIDSVASRSNMITWPDRPFRKSKHRSEDPHFKTQRLDSCNSNKSISNKPSFWNIFIYWGRVEFIWKGRNTCRRLRFQTLFHSSGAYSPTCSTNRLF